MNFIKDSKPWRWYAHRNLSSLTVDLFWLSESPNGNVWRRYLQVEEVQIQDDAKYATDQKATLALQLDEAQTLMDELWHAGMRPTNIGDPVARIEQYKDEVKWLRQMLESK